MSNVYNINRSKSGEGMGHSPHTIESIIWADWVMNMDVKDTVNNMNNMHIRINKEEVLKRWVNFDERFTTEIVDSVKTVFFGSTTVAYNALIDYLSIKYRR